VRSGSRDCERSANVWTVTLITVSWPVTLAFRLTTWRSRSFWGIALVPYARMGLGYGLGLM
jgi:hypothetical protein